MSKSKSPRDVKLLFTRGQLRMLARNGLNIAPRDALTPEQLIAEARQARAAHARSSAQAPTQG